MLAGRASVEVVELREEEKVPGRIPERAFVCQLDAGGTEMDSLEFSRFIEERRMSGQDLCFVIGGPRGLDVDDAHMRLSFGRMTLPHQMARVVLLEQLYRAHKIIAREPYHY
jgi:23S rRNA (pseudouridine1915-N3)-methyltransferase